MDRKKSDNKENSFEKILEKITEDIQEKIPEIEIEVKEMDAMEYVKRCRERH